MTDYLTRQALEDRREFWESVASFLLLPVLFVAVGVVLLYLGD